MTDEETGRGEPRLRNPEVTGPGFDLGFRGWVGSEAPRTTGGQERAWPSGCLGQLSRDQKQGKGGLGGDTTEKAEPVTGQ